MAQGIFIEHKSQEIEILNHLLWTPTTYVLYMQGELVPHSQ